MNKIQEIIKILIEKAGLNEPSVVVDDEHKRFSIFINEGPWFKSILPRFIDDLDHIVKLIARKRGVWPTHIDVNNYRREREKIISELAKAAARKAVAQKTAIDLPAMNAYERRIIHSELAARPDVTTKSYGEGKDRHVVVMPSDL